MTKKHTAVLFCLLLSALVCRGGDSHNLSLSASQNDLRGRAAATLKTADKIEADLADRGYESPQIALVRSTIEGMQKDTTAWRELKSRTTSTQKKAKQRLEGYLGRAQQELKIASNQLAARHKAEHEAWARANPEEARLQDLERRVQDAEDGASNARSAANNALWAAQAAAEQARSAEYEARNAQNRADDAENRIRRNEAESDRWRGSRWP